MFRLERLGECLYQRKSLPQRGGRYAATRRWGARAEHVSNRQFSRRELAEVPKAAPIQTTPKPPPAWRPERRRNLCLWCKPQCQ